MPPQKLILPSILAGVTTVKLEVHVPESHLNELMDALSEAGAGVTGLYNYVFAVSPITGYWRAHERATPYQETPTKLPKPKR